MSTSVFITGASGYIGGAIFHLLLQHKEKYAITAMVREEKQASKFHDLGVKTVLGDLNDSEVITKSVVNSDVVIHTANADHMGSAQAIIAGLEQRLKSGKKAIFIQTSGTGVLLDLSEKAGEATEKVYLESDLARTDGHNPKAFHRDVELEIITAANRINNSNLSYAIVSPSMIYGVANGPIKVRSQQVPYLITIALKNRQTYTVGRGLNTWINVNILNLADFYLLLLEKLVKGEKVPTYYFAENGENNLKEIAEKIAKRLYHNKAADTDEAKTTNEEEQAKVFSAIGKAIVGYTSKGRADNARKLGWKPTRSPLLDSIDEEVDYRVNNKNDVVTF